MPKLNGQTQAELRTEGWWKYRLRRIRWYGDPLAPRITDAPHGQQT